MCVCVCVCVCLCVYYINSFAFVFSTIYFSIVKISKIQYLISLGKMKISVSPLHILTS